jgi:multidrug efflux pump
LSDVQKRLEKLELPPGYEIKYAGEKEEQDKAQAFLSKAFAIAILLVTMVLVIQFNSLMVPFIIMTTVVLSLIGALMGLLICDLPFGIIMTGIGVISLAGVVVNNAIVLLAYTRQLQQKGLDLVSAAAEAGVTRLRPVMLTAMTTITGLIPMAIGISFDIHTFTWATRSESTQWWRNMAVVVIFGLGFATLLTLVVVPSLYVMLSRLRLKLGFHQVDAEHPRGGPDTVSKL